MMFDTKFKYLWFDYHFDYSYRENLALKAELQKVSGPPPTPSMTTPVCTVSMLITLYGKHIYRICRVLNVQHSLVGEWAEECTAGICR